ncbi:MAG: rhodanese-like domain-containing protein [Anaerolineae bacterium]|nr:rhodanese-like domain-containing protein [Candidatus Roseilinea sp.]MDW8450834.1 rhodanese-like domain-containing protein [Anaerolineae bacterium]
MRWRDTFALGLVLALLAGCSSAPAPEVGATNPPPAAVQQTGESLTALPPNVSVSEAAALRDAGAFMLDVREPFEWDEYHMPGATLIPLGALPSRLNELPKDKPIVVVCRSGNRSQVGRDILLRAGFTAVTSMDGGMRAWRNAGLPVTQ